MPVNAAGALQHVLVNHCCCFGECCDSLGKWGNQATRTSLSSTLQRLFYEFNARRSFPRGGFYYEPPVVDGPFVYNGFVSWYLFLFHLLCSPLVSRPPRIITTKSYIGFVMYYACGAYFTVSIPNHSSLSLTDILVLCTITRYT